MPVPATGFDVDLSLYDEFSRYPDGSIQGQAPIVGANWKESGEVPPTIDHHYLVSKAQNGQRPGYLYSIQPTPVNELGCDIVWSGGSDMTRLPMTLTISPDTTTLTLTRMLHFNFGPTGFSLSFGDAVGAGAPLAGVTAGSWTVPMKNDGTTTYRVKMAVRGNGVVIFGPNGEVFGWSDTRVSQFTGGLCFLEPTLQYENDSPGLNAMVKRAWAVSRNSDNPPSPYATNDDFAAFGNYFFYGRVVGALNRMGEVDIGFIVPTFSFPQIQFGPQNIITSILSDVSIGADKISSVDFIPAGTQILIDPGPNQETRTTTAYTVASDGLDPPQHVWYDLAIPALTKAHAAGAIVQCAAPSRMSYTVIYNQISQVLQFPVDADRSVSFGKFAFAAELDPNRNVIGHRLYLDVDGPDAGFITSSHGAVRLGVTNTFTTGRGGTAARPKAHVDVGAQFYDTDLNKPIWVANVAANGTVDWRDAAGTPV